MDEEISKKGKFMFLQAQRTTKQIVSRVVQGIQNHSLISHHFGVSILEKITQTDFGMFYPGTRSIRKGREEKEAVSRTDVRRRLPRGATTLGKAEGGNERPREAIPRPLPCGCV